MSNNSLIILITLNNQFHQKISQNFNLNNWYDVTKNKFVPYLFWQKI
jgi:hypothetical protein